MDVQGSNRQERLTLSGLLVTNRPVEIKQIVRDKDGNTKSITFSRSNTSSIFISSLEASEVLVGDRIYALRDSTIAVEDKIPQIIFDTPAYNMSQVPYTWENITHLSQYTPRPIPYDHFHTVSWLLWFLSAGFMIMIIFKYVSMMRKIRHLQKWIQMDHRSKI